MLRKADLSGHPRVFESQAGRQRMGCCPQSVLLPIPRTVKQMSRQTRMGLSSYTEFRILPNSRSFLSGGRTCGWYRSGPAVRFVSDRWRNFSRYHFSNLKKDPPLRKRQMFAPF